MIKKLAIMLLLCVGIGCVLFPHHKQEKVPVVMKYGSVKGGNDTSSSPTPHGGSMVLKGGDKPGCQTGEAVCQN